MGHPAMDIWSIVHASTDGEYREVQLNLLMKLKFSICCWIDVVLKIERDISNSISNI